MESSFYKGLVYLKGTFLWWQSLGIWKSKFDDFPIGVPENVGAGVPRNVDTLGTRLGEGATNHSFVVFVDDELSTTVFSKHTLV